MKLYIRFLKENLFLKENRRLIILVCITMLFSTLFAFLSPAFSKVVMDAIMGKNRKVIDSFTIFSLIILLISMIIGFLQNKIIIYITQKIALNMRRDFFSTLQNMSWEYLDKVKEGEMQYRMFSDIMLLAENASVLPLNVFFNILFVLIANIAILFVDYRVFLFINTIMVGNIVIYFAVNKKIENYTKSLQQYSEYAYGVVQDQLGKIKLSQMYMAERKEAHNAALLLENLKTRLIERNLFVANTNIIFQIFFSLWSIGLLWLGSRAVFSGSITLGDLTAFIAVTGLIMPIGTQLVSLVLKFPVMKVSMERYYEIIDKSDGPDDVRILSNHSENMDRIWNSKDITFADIKVTFPANKDKTLIYKGEHRIANHKINLITGKSGRGKSTLLKVISKLHPLYTGDINFGDENLAQMDFQFWRQYVKYIDISNPTFNGSILENLVYGCTDIDFEEVQKICEVLCLHDMIAVLPDTYYTTIGKNGISLSDGEKQRIALARCLLTDPRIIILDEIGANVDAKIFHKILSYLDGLKASKTIILASHRKEAIEYADQIINLDEVVEEISG